MKKLTVVMVVVFAMLSAVSVFAADKEASKENTMKCGKMEMKKECMQNKDGKGCCGGFCLCCGINADFSVKNTKDGAVIELKATKDGADAAKIQEFAKGWLENRGKCMEKCKMMKEKK
ncbi:MAG TPA: hypothetical protein PLB12_10605 [Candidatus Goldiibacteriota bacterium]|nr:hypothetical protein [Candidatus Goldiibacteriota bacterium]HPI03026.1 hypothetical protein [Candidatus Goldiibacteriota bacterium]HPN65249.1 hypothetical protein [Candidatus Goldiibacteriota bacterium]HRQ44783.1 hypothetical protein [Candidatus Goldiibacteriota bacterium]